LVAHDLHVAQAQPVALGAQRADGQQRLCCIWHRAVAVLPLTADVGHLGGRGDRRQPTVGLEAQLFLGHVVDGQERIGGHVELHFAGCLGRCLALHLANGLGDHLAVQVVPHSCDVTALRLAQQVAGAPNLQVAHGDLEAAAQLGCFADGLQPLVGLLAEASLGRMEQVRIGA